MNDTQHAKAASLRALHHRDTLLVLPNVWDVLGATLLERLGYPAIATASASIAFTNGYDDGEQIPFDDLLKILNRIASSVNVPVTADIESGYADPIKLLEENIKKLIGTGIAGINVEDSDKHTGRLLPTAVQCERIHAIKKISAETGIPLFINARTDVYIKNGDLPEEEKLQQTIERGIAYKDAGADCLYPITLKEEEAIRRLIQKVSLPLNILLLPGIPDFTTLKEIGVARLSLGPGFLKIAINALKNTAEKLLRQEGMEDIIHNPVDSAYLKTLIPHQ